MKLFKKVRERAITNPKSTKRGVLYSIFIAVVGILLTEVAKTNPALAEIIEPNTELIYTGLSAGVLYVVKLFAEKED